MLIQFEIGIEYCVVTPVSPAQIPFIINLTPNIVHPSMPDPSLWQWCDEINVPTNPCNLCAY